MKVRDFTITSNNLKAALLANLRFQKGYKILATECGIYHADVLVITKKQELHEIETKVSWNDFLQDFKKAKHKTYKKLKCEHIPHKFFFCLPSSLAEKAKLFLEEKKSDYGVISYTERKFKGDACQNFVRVIKRAKNLHNNELQQTVIDCLLKRMSSELTKYAVDFNLY